MSFTADIKRELSGTPLPASCRLAALCALIDACSVFGEGRLVFVSESEESAAYFLALCEEVCGVRMQVASATVDPKRERGKLTFSCEAEEAERLAAVAAYRPATEEESAAYLRAAFLGSGSCTLPQGAGKTGYHLEIVCRSAENAEKVCELLDGLQVIGNVVRRGERHVVYLKSREAIADFLYAVGAEHALRRMERVFTAREESNHENRVSNCYAGNADRAAIASAEQVVALTELERRGVLETLPAPLRETARARMENPTLSLGELAKLLNLTKSCLNHRLRKLLQVHGENRS